MGVVVLPGVKAHNQSVPFPLHHSLLMYDEQRALTIQIVPFDTHPEPNPAPVRATEQAALVVNAKSPQALTLHAIVPVVIPTGKA